MSIIESLQRHPPEWVAIRIGSLDIAYGWLVADVMAAAAAFAAKRTTAGTESR